MVLVVFQTHSAGATSCKDWYGYNRALASCGGVATAIGSSGSTTPASANDGINSTYWQSSSTTGWLAVAFNQRYYMNQVHIHFLAGSTVYPKLTLYVDNNGNGQYDSSEANSTTTNTKRDVVWNFTTAFALGIKISIDAKVGSNYPKIAEFEAYLLNDPDGDGLTNDQETATVYYQDMSAGGMPSTIPDAGTGVSSSATSLTQFYGIPLRALANFTVDDQSKSDLSATVGYWNGTGWTDYLVWDPGIEVRGLRISKPDLSGYYTGVVSVAALVKDPGTTSKVEFRVNGTLKSTVTTPTGYEYRWSWDTTSLGDSLPILNATRYDVNGSKAWDQLVVKVNNVPPSAAWLAPGNATRAQGNVTLVARATDFHGIDRVEFYVDGVLRATVSAANAGPNNYSWVWNSLPFSSGWHTLKATAWDVGGLKSAGVTRSLYVDNVLGVAILRPTATDYYTGTVAVVVSVEDTSVTTKVEFRVDGTLKATSTTPIGGNYTWNWTTANEDALRVVNVTQYDAVGQGAWYQVTAKVDNLPPTNVWISPLNGNTVHDTVTLKVSASDFYGIQKVRFFVDGGLVGEDTAPDPGTNYFTALWDAAQYCHNDQHTLSAMAIENTALAKSATPYISVVRNAVDAAQQMFDKFVDWIVDSVAGLVNSFLGSFVAPLIGSFSQLLDASRLMAMAVQKPGQGSGTSPEFVSAYAGFVEALANLLLHISTFQLLLLAVDIGLTALSFTGFGSLIAFAAEVAVTVAFALVTSQLVATIETVFLDVLVPALATSALVLAILGTFVAVTSALTPQWTETTYAVVRNDFRATYGELVDQVRIGPVVTQETRRIYSQTAGAGIAILLSVVAMVIASSQLVVLVSAADPLTKTITALVLDVVAMVFGVWAVIDAANIPPITSMSRWSKALAPVSLGVSVALFGADLLKYQSLTG